MHSDNSNVHEYHALLLTVKEINDTAGLKGLVPKLVVFGVMPRILISSHQLPSQVSRMKAMKTAQEETVKLVATSRLTSTITSKVPAAADFDIKIGDELFLFREKPTAKWTGPFAVVNSDQKLLTMDSGDRTWTASIDKVKLYSEHEPDSANDHAVKVAGDKDIDLNPAEHLSSEQNDIFGPFNNNENDENALGVDEFFVQIISSDDPRASSPDFQTAEKLVVDGLRMGNLWSIVNKSDIPKDGNIMGEVGEGRFIHTSKNVGTSNETAKVRLVAQGFNDKNMAYMVHDTNTLQTASIRLVLSTEAAKQFRLFSNDVTQAYLQSKHSLTRMIYINVKNNDLKTFGIGVDQLLELNKPLYGLCDAGDYWGATIERHITNGFGMIFILSGTSLYV